MVPYFFKTSSECVFITSPDGRWLDMNERAPGFFGYETIADLQKTPPEDLIAAKEQAQESDKLKTPFLANMSHEIRTSMNGIPGFADLLSTAETPEERDEYTDVIKTNGEHLLTLINDILEIAKIESGSIGVVNTPFKMLADGNACRSCLKQH